MQGLIEHHVLLGYRELDTIQRTLASIGQRLRRPADLGVAVSLLRQDQQHFAQDFAEFYPQLRAYVAELEPRSRAMTS